MAFTVVVAPDSFKGSLDARSVASAIREGWLSVRPGDEVLLHPQADGGEGTLDAVEAAIPGARRVSAGEVLGPDGRPTPGEWLQLPDGTAVVELAQMSGLPLMGELDALGATTRGLGQVLRAAAESGAKRILVGLGGSASTDAGAGALAELGLVAEGGSLIEGGAGLAGIRSLDASEMVTPPPFGVELLTDVTAPLFGPTGAAAVFGPQKGASPAEVVELDGLLRHFAELGGGDPHYPGTGAAGGTGYGLATFWGAGITSGADHLAELTGLTDAIAAADLVLTGEGRFDSQSLGGKVVGQLLQRADAAGTRVGVIAGSVDAVAEAAGEPVWTAALVGYAGSVEAAIAEPARWLHEAGADAARALGRD
ncbi:glycerate kinase [Herbiconiux sp. SYSU D00978]|uniref:glycerate kinase n=1 Tax=Herbiconiux sp. SYSU D00978 TaxID=2812562 RepID=UPI001A9659BE|nr:glycerate kinase [Herbiconiux sp. SYSU D00978]